MCLVSGVLVATVHGGVRLSFHARWWQETSREVGPWDDDEEEERTSNAAPEEDGKRMIVEPTIRLQEPLTMDY